MAKRRGKHEGTRYKRKDGLYVGRVQFDGQRHQVTSADRLERDRLLRQLIRDLEQGAKPATAGRRVLLSTVVERWLKDRALTRPATHPTWKSYSQHLLTSPLATQRVAALTTEQVTGLLQAKLDAGYAASTVRQIHCTLRTCLNWAAGQDIPVPVAILRMRPPAIPDAERTQLTPAQVGRLFRHLRDSGDRFYALWVVTWYAAARLGELLVLTWDDVDLAAGRITIRRNLVKVVDGEPQTRSGKTKSSRASLAIPKSAADALREHWRAQEDRRQTCGPAWKQPEIGRLVFDRGDGGAMRHYDAEQALYRALEAAGLPRCRPHDLRGAALSALREAGHDVLDVQRRARHASVQTTLGSYVRATDEADRRAADTLERLVLDSG